MNTTTEPPIREAIERSETITAHLTIAEKADQQAKEHTLTREAAQAELRRVKEEWNKLFEEFERRVARLAGAKNAVKFAEERTTARREKFLGFVGMPGTPNLSFLQFATELSSEYAAVDLIKLGVKRCEKELAEHKKEMLTFGKEHGIDQDTLNQLADGG